MPIPPELLAPLRAATIAWSAPGAFAADGARAWGISAWEPAAPPPPERRDALAADLERRLAQSGRGWRAARFAIGGLEVPGIISPDLDRAGAVKLGYKLGLWAVFLVREGGLDPVFTGINSRMR